MIAAWTSAAVAIVRAAVAWRLGSRRRSLPCPVWLRWLVERDNPFAKAHRAAFIVETLALDVQAGTLARARTRTQAPGLTNVEFVAASLGDDKLPAERFDRAVLVTVLGEIPDRAAALAELFGALKPGGLLAVAGVVFDPHFQSRGTVARMAVSAGFRERAFFGQSLAYIIHFEKPNLT